MERFKMTCSVLSKAILKKSRAFTKKVTIRLGLTIISALAYAQTAAAAPTVPLSNNPLYASKVAPANMLLALSVEYPTVGAAYRDAFNPNRAYIGYFDSQGCYSYDISASYFRRQNTAGVKSTCSGKFSGSFLNWATASSIDILRYVLTGGDRVVDNTPSQSPAGETVLQRANLYGFFYNNAGLFPAKLLPASISASYTPYSGDIYIANCLYKVFMGSQSTGDCDNPNANADKSGAMVARVKVCDVIEGPVRPELCQAYGNYFKPTGEMQRNGTQIRMAAFGYLSDNTENRYGGVLRSPMKYVAPISLDNQFKSVANTLKEWDETTGVFIKNPYSAPEGQSGVTQYLNKFGTVSGYKVYDPVGELYYEALRYYVGLTPTPEAVNNINTVMKDGFPVYTNWDDKPSIIAACQKNYIISIADTNTWHDKYIPGNTLSEDVRPNNGTRNAEHGFNAMIWDNKIGVLENRNNLASELTGVGNATYHMAGLAYWARTTDLRDAATSGSTAAFPGKQTVKTFSIDVNEASGNPTIKRQLYLAGKYGGFDDINNNDSPCDSPTVASTCNSPSAKAEWADGTMIDATTGAVIDKPKGYFGADQPELLIAGIKKIFAQINSESGTTAGSSLTSGKYTLGGTNIYQPGFNPSNWSGKLQRYALSLDVNGNVQLANTPASDAAVSLSNTVPSSRAIWTRVNNQFVLRDFTWASFNNAAYASIQTLFNKHPDTNVVDNLGQDRLNFVRGERSKEQGQANSLGFRIRGASPLGDIVNSAPVYVGAPNKNVTGTGYPAFYTANINRTPMVYVGANDGMLHGFAADTLQEKFAYIPSAVLKNLPKLTSAAYIHQPFVDAVPIVADALTYGNAWRSVLVGGLGAGGQGVYALDITNPNNFGANNLLFEFTDADDAKVGNVLGQPVVTKVRFKNAANQIVYKWYVIFASGFNSSQADGNADTNGDAYLFVLDLSKAPSTNWNLNSNYWRLPLKTGNQFVDSSKPNALSTPTVRYGVNDDARAIYAGDLQGNMWKWDTNEDFPNTWGDQNLAVAVRTPIQLFQTPVVAGGTRQPITQAPEVITNKAGGQLVLFGTGKLIETGDTTDNNGTQSFYGIWDNNTPQAATLPTVKKSELMPRTASKNAAGEIVLTGNSFTYSTGPLVNNKKGWYFDFYNSATTGERSVSSAEYKFGLLAFSSLETGGDICSGGTGSLYQLDPYTGLPPDGSGKQAAERSQIGYISAPMFLELDTLFGNSASSGRGAGVKRFSILTVGTGSQQSTDSGVAKQIAATKTKGKTYMHSRWSWRELFDFNTQKKAGKL